MNSGTDAVSVAHMVAPANWTQPSRPRPSTRSPSSSRAGDRRPRGRPDHGVGRPVDHHLGGGASALLHVVPRARSTSRSACRRSRPRPWPGGGGVIFGRKGDSDRGRRTPGEAASIPAELSLAEDPPRPQGAAARPPRRWACGRRASSRSPTRSGMPRCRPPTPRASGRGSARARTPARSSATSRPSTTPRGHADGRGPAPGGAGVCPRPRRGRRRLRREPLRPRAAPRGRPAPRGRRRGGERGVRGAGLRRGGRVRSGSRPCSPRCGTPPRAPRSPSSPSATAPRASPASTSRGRSRLPPTRHLDAFEYLRRENAHFTIHAGEAFGLPSIWEAIQWCGADRLGHGVRIVDDITVRDRAFGDDVAAAIAADASEVHLGPSRGLRQGHAHPARDVPQQQCPDGCGGLHRPAPDLPAQTPEVPASRSTPTTGS